MQIHSNILQSLYDLVHSDDVRQLKHTHHIKNALYKPIMAVLQNDAALSEAKNWKAFLDVIKHHENINYRSYELMDKDESMCMSLYMYIHY